MKNVIALLFISLFFTNCDKIPPRIAPVKPDCVLDSSVMVVNTNTATSNTKKVLLEDYTGHTCGNCPPAIAKVEDLNKRYPKVIAIANHVSETYAAPKTTAYFEDFRNPASTAWDVFFGMSGAGLPKGTVNRVLISNKYPQGYTAWEGSVVSELAKPQTVKLDVTTYYDPVQKILNVKVFTTFKAALSFNVNLTMVLTQDSLVSDQKDYTPPAGSQVVDSDRRPDFRFDHMVVKSLNDTWGQLIKASPIMINDTVTLRKNCNLSTKCFYSDKVCTDDKRMYLVVFAFNETTKEVLQVERVKIR